MLNAIYQLKKTRQFDIAFEDILIDDKHILVRPTHLAICNADQRYYQGKRSEDIMKQKLPMALIHEGAGKVVYDPTNTFAIGTKVAMIPNTPQEEDAYAAENYIGTSKFRGSNMDGFLQEYIWTEPDRIVALPSNINMSVAAFTEMVSVSAHAIERLNAIAHKQRDTIGVFGDGNLGYITALLLTKMMPNAKIHVFGIHKEKLSNFTFVDKIFLMNDNIDILSLNHCFECVGGSNAAKVINKIIDLMKPEGTISLLGVSEDLVAINTRLILEKGLKLFGSSRSGKKDFEKVIDMYEKYPDILGYLENIINCEVKVRNIVDIITAFETDIHKISGKTILVWDK